MKEIFELINQMSPYLLLGFLLAGLMHAFIPKRIYSHYLGGNSFRTVFNAALFGVPLPLCSCGVIPTAMSLRKEGASKSATVSFLIATPQTGVDSIIATYSLMGLPFAILRPVAALLTAFMGGEIVNLFDKEQPLESNKKASEKDVRPNFGQGIAIALRYAFVDMIQDIGRWLVVGLVVAGLITLYVPDEFFALFADSSLLSMLVVLVAAIPMYLCATGSIPIAVALMLKGLSPGTALVLLMAGPAVNVASMLVVGRVMGRRTLLLYILSIVFGAVLLGLGVDYLLPREWFTVPIAQMAACCDEPTSYFNIGCSILLLLLMVNALIRRFVKRDVEAESCVCQHQMTIYQIEGLRCNHCCANTTKAILALRGVESVKIDLASGQAVVVGSVKREEIKRVVEALGFRLKE